MLSKLFLLFIIAGILSYIFWFIRKWDGYEPEPWINLLLCFFMGGLMVLVERFVFRFFLCKIYFNSNVYEFTIRINDEYSRNVADSNFATLGRSLFSALLIGGLLKEGLKYFAFEYCTAKYKKDLNEAKDAIVYAIMIGLGFAVVDILFHYYIDLLPYKIVAGDLPGLRLNLLWVTLRLLLVHLSASFIVGLGYSFYKFNYETSNLLRIRIPLFLKNNRKLFLIFSGILALLIHGGIAFIYVKRDWLGVILGTLILCTITFIVIRTLKKFNNIK